MYFSLLKKPPGVFRFVTLTLEVPKKKSFNPLKFCDTPWKFQGQKPRPMQIHMIFLWTPLEILENNSWNFHMFFPFFFWNSPI